MKYLYLFALSIITTGYNAQTKPVFSITPTKNISCAMPSLINGKFYFAGNDPSVSGQGVELFSSDSTEAGTLLTKDIYSTPFFGSNPEKFTKLNSTQAVFWAQDASNGKELWVTDGTNSGTNLVKDITPGSSNNAYDYFINVGSAVYFMANNGTNGFELWKTDGTNSGTNMIKDINPSGNGMDLPATVYSFIYYGKCIANIGSTVFFVANDGSTGFELWKTDGTSSGTTLVKDIYTGSNSSKPNNFIVVNGVLYFSATTNAEGTELWKSDGTTAGTVLVKDLSPLFASNTNPKYLVSLNNKIYFSGTVDSKSTLFESDGTAIGTNTVFVAPNYNSELCRLTKVDTSIYFFDRSTGTAPDYSLYKFESISNTFNLIKSNMYGATSGPVYQPTKESAVSLNGMLYFTFDNYTNGDELWQSDGTNSGTKMITDIGVGSLTSWIDNLIPVSNGLNSRLYFTSTKKTGLLYIKTDIVYTNIPNINGSSKTAFSIFPNPAKEILNIEIDQLNNEPILLTITNVLGEVIISNEFENKTKLTLNTSHLNSGVYFVTLENSGAKSTQKIIIE